MLHYIIQTIAFQLFFLIIYDAFLKKETFFNWNRAYLIITALLSIALPFIKVEQFKDVVPQQFIIKLPGVIIGDFTQTESNLILEKGIEKVSEFVFSWELFLGIGVAIALIVFMYKLLKIAFLIYKNPKYWQNNLRIVKLINSDTAFSFFHYVFLGEYINNVDKEVIIKHESIHVKEKHTLDLLVFEILRIVFWFNPLVYIYQNRVRTLHEFIADSKAVKTFKRSTYYENLLAQVFETKNVSFINAFFKQSLIKKRIIMLSKSRSKQIFKLKYVLLVPVILGMLIYTSCTQEMAEKKIINQEKNINSDNNILKNIEILKESIAAKGEMTEEEEKALKTLMMLVTKNGLNEPFFNDVIERAEIPFGVIENVPLYPGCENLISNDERRKCMAEKITKHVQQNFDSDLAGDIGLTGRQRINVVFKIDADGNVTGIRSRAPHPKLEEEAIRVISLLPKMKPGKQDGQNVTVPYSLPIIFQVEE
jgi:bla regulator protein blaR1